MGPWFGEFCVCGCLPFQPQLTWKILASWGPLFCPARWCQDDWNLYSRAYVWLDVDKQTRCHGNRGKVKIVLMLQDGFHGNSWWTKSLASWFVCKISSKLWFKLALTKHTWSRQPQLCYWGWVRDSRGDRQSNDDRPTTAAPPRSIFGRAVCLILKTGSGI